MLSTPVVRINCGHQGTPPFNVTWLHNGERVKSYGRVAADSFQLRINPTTPSDSGFYQCLVNNSAGSAQATAELFVSLAGSYMLGLVWSCVCVYR